MLFPSATQVKCDSFEKALAAIRFTDKLCTLLSCQTHCVKNTNFIKCSVIQHTFCGLVPTPLGSNHPGVKNCVWDTPVRYALQLDILLLLQRISEHFASSSCSLQVSRNFDAVRIVVAGAIAALADCMIRKIATDIPSEVSEHINGYRAGGYAFGLSVNHFATQTNTIETTVRAGGCSALPCCCALTVLIRDCCLHTQCPEVALTRTQVLDYFYSLHLGSSQQVFCFENGNAPEGTTSDLIARICKDNAFPQNSLPLYVSGEMHLIIKNYPEFALYRDIAFWFKYYMNTDRECLRCLCWFLSFCVRRVAHCAAAAASAHAPARLPTAKAFPPVAEWTQQHASLVWKFEQGVYKIIGFGMPLSCRSSSKEVRFRSSSDPSALVAPDVVSTEDDVLHIKNLPSFDDLVGQRDSELLISYLTVPYMRIPLCLAFFSTEDRVHTLKNRKLQDVLDSVVFEPGKYLPFGSQAEPKEVPTQQPRLLATPYGLLINELSRSPESVLQSAETLLKLALDLDTDSVYATTIDVILYVVRTVARIESYLSFLIDHAQGRHTYWYYPLRDVQVTQKTLAVLIAGQAVLRKLLRNDVHK